MDGCVPRKSRREAQRVDYAALDEGLEIGVETGAKRSKWVEYVEKRAFGDTSALVQWLSTGSELTLDWARRTGLKRPTVVKDSKGLGLLVPRKADFGVRDIAKIVGENTPIEVINTSDQSEVTGWSILDWCNYWDGRRSKTLNVISLEFSRTKLSELVRSPTLVRQLDWIDNAWPEALRVRGEYPQTQYYCLMSPEGCYTDFHVDFGGTAVWYHILKGRKIFYLSAPTHERLALYEKWICSKNQDATFFADLMPDSATAALTLHQGQTLIIPSAWLHAVYTPEDSIVFGGNFLPGLTTISDQLAVHGVESRARVANQFRFPFFTSAMFFGLARTYKRLVQEPKDQLTKLEKQGLSSLIDACRIWSKSMPATVYRGPSSDVSFQKSSKEHAMLAATSVGATDPSDLVEKTAALYQQIMNTDHDQPPSLRDTRPVTFKLRLGMPPKPHDLIPPPEEKDSHYQSQHEDDNSVLSSSSISSHSDSAGKVKSLKLKISSAWLEQAEPPPPPSTAAAAVKAEASSAFPSSQQMKKFPNPTSAAAKHQLTKKRPAPGIAAKRNNSAIGRLKTKLAKMKR